jgi:hypothetical protein
MKSRLSLVTFCLLLFCQTLAAEPCAQIKSRPDTWIETKVDALVLAAGAVYKNDKAQPAYDRLVKEIAGTLQQCRLARDEDFLKEHREFIEFVDALSIAQSPDHELGFLISDKQYFDETRAYVQIPEFLLTQTFLRTLSRHETLPRAKSLLRQLNSTRASADQLIFFSYRSQHLGTPDNDDSFERLLIVVPGDTEKGVPEKWVQFGISDRGARVRIRNLSIVAAMPQPDRTTSIYFKDFFRTYRRDGSINVTGRWETGNGDDNCASCHKSGVLPIFPDPGSVSANEMQALEEVNQRFLLYSAPRFQNYLDETRFGPGLGSGTPESRAQRFGAGFNETPVARAMTCSSCHQPQRLGALNWPMDSTLIGSFVEGGKMPLGQQLKTSERNEVHDKLIQEYFAIDKNNPGVLKAWLLGRSKQKAVGSRQ